jgi:hypothetical protein
MTDTTKDLLARLVGFTPGPWEAALQAGCHGVVAACLGDDFNMVALIGNDTDTPEKEPARFANAALIAAAPDLYRICTEQHAEIERLRGALVKSRDEIDHYILQEYNLDHPVHERYRQRDFGANPARKALEATP